MGNTQLLKVNVILKSDLAHLISPQLLIVSFHNELRKLDIEKLRATLIGDNLVIIFKGQGRVLWF